MKAHHVLLVLGGVVLAAIVGSGVSALTFFSSWKPAAPLPSVSPVVESPTVAPDSTPDPTPDSASPPDSAAHTPPNPDRASTSQNPTQLAVSRTAEDNFLQFQPQLLKAVQARDAKFIRSLITPQTQWSFGGRLSLENYKIDDPQSPFWLHLEKAIAAGCLEDFGEPTTRDPGTQVWVCPRTLGKSITTFGWTDEVGILGDSVNVRSLPRDTAPVIGTLNRQVVKFDRKSIDLAPPDRKTDVFAPNGWTPIILPSEDNLRGWVANRYAFYEPRDYRVSFYRLDGKWQMRYFLKGDGN